MRILAREIREPHELRDDAVGIVETRTSVSHAMISVSSWEMARRTAQRRSVEVSLEKLLTAEVGKDSSNQELGTSARESVAEVSKTSSILVTGNEK